MGTSYTGTREADSDPSPLSGSERLAKESASAGMSVTATATASNPTPTGATFYGTFGTLGTSSVPCNGAGPCTITNNRLTHGTKHSFSAGVTDGRNTRACNGSVSTNSLPSATPQAPACGTPGPEAWDTKNTTVQATNCGTTTNNTGSSGISCGGNKTVTCPAGFTFSRTNTNTDGFNSGDGSNPTTCYPKCRALPAGFRTDGGPSCSYGVTGNENGVSATCNDIQLTSTCPTTTETKTITCEGDTGQNKDAGPGGATTTKAYDTVNNVTVNHYYKGCTATNSRSWRVVTKEYECNKGPYTKANPKVCDWKQTGSTPHSPSYANPNGGCKQAIFSWYGF